MSELSKYGSPYRCSNDAYRWDVYHYENADCISHDFMIRLDYEGHGSKPWSASVNYDDHANGATPASAIKACVKAALSRIRAELKEVEAADRLVNPRPVKPRPAR